MGEQTTQAATAPAASLAATAASPSAVEAKGLLEAIKAGKPTGLLRTAERAPEPAPSEAAAPKPPASDPRLADIFSEAARTQAKLAKQQREITAREAALRPLMDLERIAKDDPEEAMRRIGVDYDALTMRRLGQQPKPKTAEEKLEELRADYQKRFEEMDARERERAEKDEAARHKLVSAEISSEIIRSGKYPIIAATGTTGDVVDAVGAYIKEFGEAPSMDQIHSMASFVEGHYREQAQKLAPLLGTQQAQQAGRQEPERKVGVEAEAPARSGQTMSRTGSVRAAQDRKIREFLAQRQSSILRSV